MDDWTTIAKLSLGAVLTAAMIGLGVFVFAVTNDAATSQFEAIADSTNFGEWDAYDGVSVDRATGKNIARANKDRINVSLGGTLLSVDPRTAHTQINSYFDAAATYEITVVRENGTYSMDID